jgi:hypothetical protein
MLPDEARKMPPASTPPAQDGSPASEADPS